MHAVFRSHLTVLAGLLVFSACSKRDSLNNSGDPQDEQPLTVELALETPSSLNLAFNQSSQVSVRAFYKETQDPVKDLQVSFDAPGSNGGASLSTTSVFTDATGRARTRIIAGSDRATFSVFVTAQGTNELQIDVTVDGVYVGDLRVALDYEGGIPLGDVVTRLHSAASPCSGMDFNALPPALDTETGVGEDNVEIFTDLPEDTSFTVTVVAEDAGGLVVATGCAGSPPIVGRDLVNVVVPLGIDLPTLEGTYDFGVTMHTDEALPGSLGDVIDDVNSLSLDPTSFLAAAIVDQVSNFSGISEGIVEVILTTAWIGYADSRSLAYDQNSDGSINFADAVYSFTLAQAPGWVTDVLTISGDLTELTKNLTVGGKMEITGVDYTASELTGHWDWGDFMLLWRYNEGCDLSDTCCGRQEYRAADLGLTAVGADFTGSFTLEEGSSAPQYNVTIPPHEVALRYGEILTFVLNNLVLPELLGSYGTAEAIEALLGCDNSTTPATCGCDRVGKFMSDFITDPIFGSLVAAAGTAGCLAAVAEAEDWVESELAALTYSGGGSHFDMELAFTIGDEDGDDAADIFAGDVVGDLVLDGTPGQTTFTGDIRGDTERVACLSNAACDGGGCAVGTDLLNTCSARQVCMPPVGAKLADETCSADGQCFSGTCLIPTGTVGRCFQACGGDLDCPGATTCHLSAATIDLGNDITTEVNTCAP